ncbi:hypothetical protein BDF14DRAFT_1861372 [Spinellus fusiger]|nr:hypothetical protein BDF14DRAFT_1861372 [Spinellus fusiger]
MCDECNCVIQGNYYKCSTCIDYDLCQSCEQRASQIHDASHIILRIKSAADIYRSPMPSSDSFDPSLEVSSVDSAENTHSLRKASMTLSQSFFEEVSMRKSPNVSDISNTSHCSHDAQTNARISSSSRSSSRSRASARMSPTPFQIIDGSSSQSSPEIVASALPKTTVASLSKAPTRSSSTLSANDLYSSTHSNTPEACQPSSSFSHVTSPASSVGLSAAFIADITIPDGTQMVPNHRFLKIWRLKNNGVTVWPTGCKLVHTGDNIFSAYSQETSLQYHLVPVTLPQNELFVMAELRAPGVPGRYIGYFRLSDAEGTLFGHHLWCDVTVAGPTTLFQEQQEHQDPYHVHHHHVQQVLEQHQCMIYPILTSSASDNDSITDDISHDGTAANNYASPIISYPTSVRSPRSDRSDCSYSSLGDLSYSPSMEEHLEPESYANDLAGSIHRQGSSSPQNSTNGFVIVEEEPTLLPLSEEEEEEPATATAAAKVATDATATAATVNSPTPDTTAVNNSIYTEAYSYSAQLIQIHEMGFTFCDDLAIQLLEKYNGNIDQVVPEILESLYPE